MGDAHVAQGGQWKFWFHLGLFWVEAAVFLKILRFALREPANMDGSDFWFPQLALCSKSSPNLISSSVKWELCLP